MEIGKEEGGEGRAQAPLAGGLSAVGPLASLPLPLLPPLPRSASQGFSCLPGGQAQMSPHQQGWREIASQRPQGSLPV